MAIVVPDASVILKWALPSGLENGTDTAGRLRDAICREDVRAVVPSLWIYEVGNTVARRFPDQAGAWLAALMKLGLEEAPVSRQWLSTVLELTRCYAVSFYDASYHATALVHGGVFVTADQRYVRTTQRHGAVVALDEWVPPNDSRRS